MRFTPDEGAGGVPMRRAIAVVTVLS